jgi:hypothetical protein
MSVDFTYFPEVFRTIVAKVADRLPSVTQQVLNFEYGTYAELLEKLVIKDNNQNPKYPLIWLSWEPTENQAKWIDPNIYTISAHIFICDFVDRDAMTEERYAVTGQHLYSILELLYDEMQNCINIGVQPKESGYNVTDHPSWLKNANDSFDILSALEVKYDNLLMYKF